MGCYYFTIFDLVDAVCDVYVRLCGLEWGGDGWMDGMVVGASDVVLQVASYIIERDRLS
jgi:hypothetical protein